MKKRTQVDPEVVIGRLHLGGETFFVGLVPDVKEQIGQNFELRDVLVHALKNPGWHEFTKGSQISLVDWHFLEAHLLIALQQRIRGYTLLGQPEIFPLVEIAALIATLDPVRVAERPVEMQTLLDEVVAAGYAAKTLKNVLTDQITALVRAERKSQKQLRFDRLEINRQPGEVTTDEACEMINADSYVLTNLVTKKLLNRIRRGSVTYWDRSEILRYLQEKYRYAGYCVDPDWGARLLMIAPEEFNNIVILYKLEFRVISSVPKYQILEIVKLDKQYKADQLKAMLHTQ